MEVCGLCTGGASGIGRATALALAARGVHVTVGDVDLAGAEETVRLIERNGARARAAAVDVADEAQVEAFVSAAVAAFGRLDCAANVAGTHAGLGASTADVSATDFDRNLAVNLRGTWLCVRAQLRAMLAGGAGGRIVNVSSVNGLTGAEGGVAYAIAKAGILGLTRTAAIEYAPAGVAVNSVAPGLVDTPLTDRMFASMPAGEAKRARAELLAAIPAGRMARADEIAGAVAWLCTEAPPYLTGETIVIDGGYLVRG